MTSRTHSALSLTTAIALATGIAQAQAAELDALVAAAKAEGKLTTIALPHD